MNTTILRMILLPIIGLSIGNISQAQTNDKFDFTKEIPTTITCDSRSNHLGKLETDPFGKAFIKIQIAPILIVSVRTKGIEGKPVSKLFGNFHTIDSKTLPNDVWDCSETKKISQDQLIITYDCSDAKVLAGAATMFRSSIALNKNGEGEIYFNWSSDKGSPTDDWELKNCSAN